MVLEIFEQADIDKLSFPILKLKENGLILAVAAQATKIKGCRPISRGAKTQKFRFYCIFM